MENHPDTPEIQMEDALFFTDALVFVRPKEQYGQILCEVYATWPESQTSWIVAECFVVEPSRSESRCEEEEE